VNVNLADHDGNEYSLRISDTLRATVNQPRLASVDVEEEQPISIKELQARLRSGESVESLARAAQWPIEKVERFAGPILQERSYVVGLAQDVVMRREAGRDPFTFMDMVAARLSPRQVDMTSVEWDCWRLDDATWIVRLTYPTRDGQTMADWNFDMTRKALSALDEAAQWIVGDEAATRDRNARDHGMIYGNHPAGRSAEPHRTFESHEPPRLVSIRDLPDEDDAKDGVTTRAKVPSWDEIMFGGKRLDEDSDI
jgi:hypothetical protein